MPETRYGPRTRGPWEVLAPHGGDTVADRALRVAHAGTGQPVAYVPSPGDAHAIAAVPDMLAVLRCVRPLLVAHFDAHTAMRDALREGRTPQPIPHYQGEDQHTLDVLNRLDALLRALDPPDVRHGQ